MPNKQTRSTHTTCLICQHKELEAKKLSNHIKSQHKLSSKDYTIKCILGGNNPKCPECGVEPRYVAFSFKTYCKEHSFMGEVAGGEKGGKIKSTWNKGKTIKTDARIVKSTFIGADNPFFGKQHTEEAKRSNADKHRLPEEEFIKRINSRPDRFKCLSSYTDYKYRQGQKLLFQCLECATAGRETIIEHTLFNFERNPICHVCHPGGSKEQLEIADFIKSLGLKVIYNDREAIKPKELDIYVPSKKLAIEYDSFYYHSYSDEDPREDRHYEKTESARIAGIDLIHIFQDEWKYKRHIVESMIAYRLGVVKRKIPARKCEIAVLDSKTSRKFFDDNHIAGYSRAGIICLGLLYNDELVAAMSFRKPFHKQKYVNAAEMARFASKVNTCVVGGLTKLLNRGINECRSIGLSMILTYADLRYGQGKSYGKAGFTENGWTGLSYDYNDGDKRYSRFKFRAQKQNSLSEHEVAARAGMQKIYGCGNNRYVINI